MTSSQSLDLHQTGRIDTLAQELALLQELQEGAMYDKASQDLGFTSDIYKKGAQYGVDELQSDAEKFMTSDLYRNVVNESIQILVLHNYQSVIFHQM